MSQSQKQAIQEQKRERERQREFTEEQKALQQAFNQQGELDKDWMAEVLNVDDMGQYLNQYEIDKVRGLLNKQWILSNLSDAQTHDRWYKLEVMKYKIYGSFPPKESAIQGPLRAFLFDNEHEQLNALTQEQRNVIDQLILTLQNMVTRSKGGFERKQTNTSIARTENGRGNEQESSGRLTGLFD